MLYIIEIFYFWIYLNICQSTTLKATMKLMILSLVLEVPLRISCKVKANNLLSDHSKLKM